MATYLYRLGALGARRWRTMTVGWLVALCAVAGLGFTFAGEFEDSGSIPGSPAQTALAAMDRHFPRRTCSPRRSCSGPRPATG
ncbi:hypothetical protein SHKM778_07200 [Streptomyces sp. KM77-8]|uniref:Uncharacterized protein n=1 Tax=Streptomyces haneummycinicus TaxID=3074435 RepID=A0AAT9HAC7_9ACTN